MSQPIIYAKHTEECVVHSRCSSCWQDPLAQCLNPLLLVLTPLVILPSLLALNIIYMPMILKFIFPMPALSRIPGTYSTAYSTGPSSGTPKRHIKLTLSTFHSCSSLSPNLLHLQACPCHLMSVPSFQLLRSPKLEVNLHSFLSLLLHIQSAFLQKHIQHLTVTQFPLLPPAVSRSDRFPGLLQQTPNGSRTLSLLPTVLFSTGQPERSF